MPRVRRSTAIRVGISAQGYAFPAPTGVVDYALRWPSDHPLLSTTISAKDWGGKGVEIDAELPLSLGIGTAWYDNHYGNGATSRQNVQSISLRWRPTATMDTSSGVALMA